MSANFLHGVETIELEQGYRSIRQVKTAVIGLTGTAYQGTPNEITLISSERIAAQTFGAVSASAGATIPQAFNAIYDQGGAIVIAVNVLDKAKHFSTATESLTAGSLVILKNQHVFDLKITDEEGTEITEYTLDATLGTVSGLENGKTFEFNYSYLDASKVTAADIIGETTADGKRTGLQALENAYPTLGFDAKIIIAPQFCEKAEVATAMIAMAEKLRAVALIDAPAGLTFQQALAARGSESNFNTQSERAILCYPHCVAYNTATGENITEPLSQRLAGVICAVDDEKGYWFSPSNNEINGIVGMEIPISARINDANSEANLLNEQGIVTIFNSYGSGYKVWGNRTAAWPTDTGVKNFINIRRVADVIHESLEYSMVQFLDQPINEALIDSICESVNSFMRTLVARGAIVDGACTFDASKNEASEIALGHLTFDLTFMPPTPCERISFESYIDINLLSNLNAE